MSETDKTFFTGAGDLNGAIGDGNRLLFNLTSNDASKQIDLTFSEDVYISDGFLIVTDAPFGAYLNLQIIHPTLGLIESFANKVPIFGTGQYPIDTSTRSALIPTGLIVRVTVYNSTGQNDEDIAADFKVAGRIKVYRDTTI